MAKKLARTFDIECYKNYFLLIVTDVRSGFVQRWETFNGEELGRYSKEHLVKVLQSSTMISFNGLNYDHAMVCGYLSDLTHSQLFDLSQWMISTEMSQWNWEREFDNIMNYEYTHIDIFGVAPGLASLKIYGGRLHHPKLQDLPVAWDKPISAKQRDVLVSYCINDNDVTKTLFQYLKEQLLLRQALGKIYGIKLLSKSDAQIAEGVIRKQMQKQGVDARPKQLKPKKFYLYEAPECIRFDSEILQAMFNTVKSAKFDISAKGSVLLPKQVREVIKYNGKKYQFGIGGLHSKESAVAYERRPGVAYVDFDVTSYYPSIILTNGYYPEPLTDKFIDVYRGIVDRRIQAKQEGDKTTADSLKIVINSSFGKFGNRYSSLYDPKLLLQTTITGQLCLLMLIEMMEKRGLEVISANTDGVMVVVCNDGSENDNEHLAMEACKEWENATGMFLEDEYYESVYKESVNSYFAIDKDGVVKGKGTYAKPGLQKNPAGNICARAVVEYLKDGSSIENTIRSSVDITEFVHLRTVAGGAIYKGTPVGKSVRWYYRKGEVEPITYEKNGNKVPNSVGAALVNKLPSKMPKDIDYQFYINRCYSMLNDLGASII